MHHSSYYSSPYYPHSYNPPPPPPSSSPPSFASTPLYAAAPPLDYSCSHNYPQFPHNIPDTTPPPPESHLLYIPPPSPPPMLPSKHQLHAPPYYPPYEVHQSVPSYPNPKSALYGNQYDKLYDNTAKYDYGSAYYEEILSGSGSFRSDNRAGLGGGSGYYEENLSGSGRAGLGGGSGYDRSSSYKEDGVYAYEGRKEQYGARGTASWRSPSNDWSGLFDDYGREFSFPGTKERERGGEEWRWWVGEGGEGGAESRVMGRVGYKSLE